MNIEIRTQSAGGRERIRVRLFAAAREKAGRDVIEVDLPPGCILANVETAMRRAHPALSVISGRWAVNRTFVSLDASVTSEDEVAFIPPVSGG